MKDVLGQALKDYQEGRREHKLYIHNMYGKKERMPLSIYFRSLRTISKLEYLALEACTGSILDVGAAAGSHALLLQKKGLNVTAMDISPGAVEVMQQRGVQNIVSDDIFSYKEKKFDTLLLLMNGIGLAGTIDSLQKLLPTFKKILKPGGQVLFDSSDVAYLFKADNFPLQHYYGEIDYEYVYREQYSGWFKWLYVDKQTMQKVALKAGFAMQFLFEDEHDQYLARLVRIF